MDIPQHGSIESCCGHCTTRQHRVVLWPSHNTAAQSRAVYILRHGSTEPCCGHPTTRQHRRKSCCGHPTTQQHRSRTVSIPRHGSTKVLLWTSHDTAAQSRAVDIPRHGRHRVVLWDFPRHTLGHTTTRQPKSQSLGADASYQCGNCRIFPLCLIASPTGRLIKSRTHPASRRHFSSP